MVGITDERDTCELCGKKNLKRCVVLEDTDTHGIVYYGTDCAARVLFPRAHDRFLAKETRALNDMWDGFFRARKFAQEKKAAGWTNQQIKNRLDVVAGMPATWIKNDGHIYARVKDDWTLLA